MRLQTIKEKRGSKSGIKALETMINRNNDHAAEIQNRKQLKTTKVGE